MSILEGIDKRIEEATDENELKNLELIRKHWAKVEAEADK